MFYRTFLFLASVILSLFFLYVVAYTPSAKPVEDIKPPLGLPPIAWPKENPYSKDKAELGRLLYFDKRLSGDQTISCASCHNIQCAYSDCQALAIGINHTIGTRHSPTIINSAYSPHLFWDGRASSLEEQCKGPLGNKNEMSSTSDAHEAHLQCSERIKNIQGYQILFNKVFARDEISINDIAQAIATFERTILSGNSPYDRYVAGDDSALTEEQLRGMKLFKKVECANCHWGFNFNDERFMNIGIGMDAAEPDLGRYAITHDDKDWGAFKVPTLRDVEHSAPYMHDGSLATLEDVIEYYNKGGIKNKNLHPLIRPLNLSEDDKKALVSFLKSLNGEGWQDFQEPNEFPQ
ncbi:MAG: cytochrome-c peroxidase [Parachlamydia sp.]|nr:MAG: cytochrome-c peroxidase [Parachlamydia sp.]